MCRVSQVSWRHYGLLIGGMTVHTVTHEHLNNVTHEDDREFVSDMMSMPRAGFDIFAT